MIRVLTYNIRGGLGMDGRREIARIANVIAAQTPDVVCLQEVHQRLPWSGWGDQPAALARALRMQVVFQRNVNILIGGYGVAILSPYALTHSRRLYLPSRGERRGALETIVPLPDGPLRVWCTHWGLHAEERVGQAERLAEGIGSSPCRTVLCSDCNETADGPATQYLLLKTGLRDAGAVSKLPTYPSDAPTARIDFVLYSPDLTCLACAAPSTLMSDHLPVVCEFESPCHREALAD